MTTQPDLELVEILKRLGLKWGTLRDRLDRDPWLPIVVKEAGDDSASMEDYDTFYDALGDVIHWLCERTDVDRWDAWEASYRLSTANGLAPWKKQTGDQAEYRDLRFIPPKLKELDRDGSTARLLAERPDIAELVDLLPVHSEGRPTSGATKEDIAMAVLTRHPDWTMTKIAEAAGCRRTSLNRMDNFQNLRRAFAHDIPRGEKDAETGTIEAYE